MNKIEPSTPEGTVCVKEHTHLADGTCFNVTMCHEDQVVKALAHRLAKEIGIIHSMEYHSAITKNEILPFAATWMDPEDISRSDISQTEEAKYYMVSLIYGI